uniref:Uncharacterized protein n=1 Tax=Nothoprocta perdicaria TaxID=30464 RepID=A0A8C6Z1N3_NOTPE
MFEHVVLASLLGSPREAALARVGFSSLSLLCAGKYLISLDAVPLTYGAETSKLMCVFVHSGRNKSSSAVSGTQVLGERSSREGSAQRVPRPPSASRLQKVGASGKTSGGNST